MPKKCNKCGKIKSLTEYHKHISSKDKKAYTCKSCAYIIKKQWNKNNPEKYRAQIARRKDSPNWPDSESRKNKINVQRKNRKALTNSYVRQLITSKGTIGENIDPKDISDELIKAHRLNLKLKRALKLTAKLKPST